MYTVNTAKLETIYTTHLLLRSMSLEASTKVVFNEAYGVAPDSLLYQQQPASEEQPSAEYDHMLITL